MFPCVSRGWTALTLEGSRIDGGAIVDAAVATAAGSDGDELVLLSLVQTG